MDLLAHEYGWAKDYILENVYLDELKHLTDAMKKRKVEDMKMQLAIVSNPHSKEPKELWDALNREIDDRFEDVELDKQGFEAFKRTLAGSSNIVVK